MPKTVSLMQAYNDGVKDARKQFADSPVLKKLFNPFLDARFLELFLIHFCAVKTGFVEPVAEYIREAGERSQKLGYEEMRDFFHHHADEEVGHDKWAIEDTHKLVDHWNKRRTPALNAQDLLDKRFTPAVRRYHELHLNVIRGNAPYGELAIDVEIERISVKFGPKMLLFCMAKVGPKITTNLTFVKKHVMADQGHDKTNFSTIEEFLMKRPETLPALVDVGKKAIEAYHGFLADCFRLAEEKMAALRSVGEKS